MASLARAQSPAGTPRKLDRKGNLGPPHGGYHDIDACPSLTFLIENREKKSIARFFHLSIDKRPGEELYDITADPANLRNLAADEKHADVTNRLRDELTAYLKKTGDPRVLNGGDIYESYKRYSRIRKFPAPR